MASRTGLIAAMLVLGILIGGIAVVVGSEYLAFPPQTTPIMEEDQLPFPSYDRVRDYVQEYLKSEEGKSLLRSLVNVNSPEFRSMLRTALTTEEIQALLRSAIPQLLASPSFQSELKSQLEALSKQEQAKKR